MSLEPIARKPGTAGRAVRFTCPLHVGGLPGRIRVSRLYRTRATE